MEASLTTFDLLVAIVVEIPAAEGPTGDPVQQCNGRRARRDSEPVRWWPHWLRNRRAARWLPMNRRGLRYA